MVEVSPENSANEGSRGSGRGWSLLHNVCFFKLGSTKFGLKSPLSSNDSAVLPPLSQPLKIGMQVRAKGFRCSVNSLVRCGVLVMVLVAAGGGDHGGDFTWVYVRYPKNTMRSV